MIHWLLLGRMAPPPFSRRKLIRRCWAGNQSYILLYQSGWGRCVSGRGALLRNDIPGFLQNNVCGCGFAPLRDLVWLLVAEGDGLEEAETDGRGLIEVDMRPVFASPDDTTLLPICWCGLAHALCWTTAALWSAVLTPRRGRRPDLQWWAASVVSRHSRSLSGLCYSFRFPHSDKHVGETVFFSFSLTII